MKKNNVTLLRILSLIAFIAVIALTVLLFGCGEEPKDDTPDKYITDKIPLGGKSPLREISKDGELNYLLPKTKDDGDYTEFFTIQIGAFGSLENAHKLLSDLKSEGYNVFLFESHIKSDSLYKVGLGTFKKKEDARAYLNELVIPGFEGLWITQVRHGSAVKLTPEKDGTETSKDDKETEMVYISDKISKVAEENEDDGDDKVKSIDKWGVWLKRGDGEPLMLAENDDRIRRPLISPDGKRVAFIIIETEKGGGKISVVDTYGSKTESIIPAPVALNHHIWISSEILAYISISASKRIANKIIIYNVIKRKGEVLISSKENLFSNLTLSPSGRFIAYDATTSALNTGGDEAVHVETINLETGVKGVIRPGFTTRLLGWYPDGNLMVAYHLEPDTGKSFKYSFAKSDPEGKNIMMLDEIKPVRNVGPGVVSPDGGHIVFVTWKITEDEEKDTRRRTPTELWLLDIEGNGARRLLKRDSILYGPAWSPRGDEIVISAKLKSRFNVFLVSDFGLSGDGKETEKKPKVKKLFDIDDNSFDASFYR
jgi:Tol biopolymer transport system component